MRRALVVLTVIVVAVLGGALAATIASRAFDDDSAGSIDAGGGSGDAIPALCGALGSEVVGRLSDPALDEVSGLVASVAQPGVWWAIEDSGAPPALVAISDEGATIAVVTINGARNTDWEDLARGPGPGGGASSLYVADIGDNGALRSEVVVYVATEPTVGGATRPTTVDAQRYVLRYPDGPRDAEAMIVDPRGGDIFVFSKRTDGETGVYRAAAPLSASSPNVMERVGVLSLGAGGLVTAADVSPTGDVVAVRTYTSVLIWNRATDETIPQAVARPPCREKLVIDGQGESLAIAAEGRSIVVVPEGPGARIRRLAPTG